MIPQEKEEKEEAYSVEEINGEPILKDISDYNTSAKLISRSLERDEENVKRKYDELRKKLDSGYYTTSPIALTYQSYTDAIVNTTFLRVEYIRLADRTIKSIKKTVSLYYINKQKHEFELKKIKEENSQIISKYKDEIKQLKDEILVLQSDKHQLNKKLSEKDNLMGYEQEIKEPLDEKIEEEVEEKVKPKKKGRPRKEPIDEAELLRKRFENEDVYGRKE